MNQKPLGSFATAPVRAKKTVTLPSNRTAILLETTGAEEKLLRMSPNKVYETLNRFLCSIIESVDGNSVTSEDLDKMLVVDRKAILIESRILSHGEIVTYNHRCPGCGKVSEHEIDLNTILATLVPYPEGDKREFEVELSAGKLCFELPTGKIEAAVAALQEITPNSKYEMMKFWEKTANGKLPVRIEQLRSKDIATLRKAIRDKEASLDTNITVTCPKCNNVTEGNLMANADFLFPNTM